MFPLVSTFWLGSVMKLPGLTPDSIGIYKPPAAASKIETLTLSPMPNEISHGGRRSGKTVPILGA